MHPQSKVWVYQSNRELTSLEISQISEMGEAFVKEWAAHGSRLKAYFEIKYDRFIILSVDESQAMASGCSIDKSVAFIEQLEAMFGIELLGRMQVAYRSNGSIKTTNVHELESLSKEKAITPDTIVFNNLVQTRQEFEEKWEVPIMDSWHNRFI
jgi:hypothetical protein